MAGTGPRSIRAIWRENALFLGGARGLEGTPLHGGSGGRSRMEQLGEEGDAGFGSRMGTPVSVPTQGSPAGR